jgi:hypothetical protein
VSGCNCINVGCECTIMGGSGIAITGIGTSGDPFVITNTRPDVGVGDTPSLDLTKQSGIITGTVRLGPLLSVQDTATVDLTLAGAGTEASPFVLSGRMAGIDLSGGNTGDVMTQQIDGSWGPGPATQAPAGTVVVGDGLRGDGSGADPLRVYPGTYAEWEGLNL